MTGAEAVIEFADVVAEYGATRALDGFSVQIAGGIVAGIVGPDGAGKTTFMRVCLGLVPASAGKVTVLGLRPSDKRLRERIGYLPQRLQVLGHLTVVENLRYFAALNGLSLREAAGRIDHLLAITGLGPFSDRLAERLSGGMRQKLALACAVIHRPELVLLDEPCTGLDPISRRDMWELIYSLASDGCSVVVATSSFEEAIRCHFVCFIEDGRTVVEGAPEDIIARAAGRVVEIPAREGLADELSMHPKVLAVRRAAQRLRAVVRDGAGEELARSYGGQLAQPTLEEAIFALGREQDGRGNRR